MKAFLILCLFASSSSAFGFEIVVENTIVSPAEQKKAEAIKDQTAAPTHMVGQIVNKVASDLVKNIDPSDVNKKKNWSCKLVCRTANITGDRADMGTVNIYDTTYSSINDQLKKICEKTKGGNWYVGYDSCEERKQR